MSCCHCHATPPETTCLTIFAHEALEGDFLDTREYSRSNPGFIARIFTAPQVRDGEVTLNVAAQRAQRYSKSARIKVWRDSTLCTGQHAPRPIDMRTDRPFRNLSEVHYAGAEGLAATFPVGSVWEVGPFTDGVNPIVVRITGAPRTSGENHSAAPEDAAARGKKCWFMPTETLYTPHQPRPHAGALEGKPPHVLAPVGAASMLNIADKVVVVHDFGYRCQTRACCQPREPHSAVLEAGAREIARLNQRLTEAEQALKASQEDLVRIEKDRRSLQTKLNKISAIL